MKFRNHIILCLLALLLVAGCAKSKITSRAELVTLPPRPQMFRTNPRLPGSIPSTAHLKLLSKSRPAVSWALKLRRSWWRISATWECPQCMRCRE